MPYTPVDKLSHNYSKLAPSEIARKFTKLMRNENGRRMLAHVEFLTEDEIADFFDQAIAEAAKPLLNGLEDVHTAAHCISKAGPLNTKTLDDAWTKFDKLAVKATNAITEFRKLRPSPAKPRARYLDDSP